MSVHEPDGVSESIDELLRIGVMLAARMAEQRVRAREQQLRDAEADSVQAAAAARDEFLRERQGALASLQGVHSDTWWAHADAGDIRHAWLTAREWAGEDPRADRAVWQIADQLKDRYGLDVHTIDPAAFGQQAELPAQATLSDRELGHLDRLLRDRAEELQAERQTASPDRAEEIDQRLGEIDGLRGEIDGQLRHARHQPRERRALDGGAARRRAARHAAHDRDCRRRPADRRVRHPRAAPAARRPARRRWPRHRDRRGDHDRRRRPSTPRRRGAAGEQLAVGGAEPLPRARPLPDPAGPPAAVTAGPDRSSAPPHHCRLCCAYLG